MSVNEGIQPFWHGQNMNMHLQKRSATLAGSHTLAEQYSAGTAV